MGDQLHPKFGNVVSIPFSKANVTTGESNTDLLAPDGVGTLWTAPANGSVVGVTLDASAAITAGTITARAQKAGTEFAETGYPAPVVSSAAAGSYAKANAGVIRFSAGNRLGVSVSTTTTLDPTNTLDVSAYLLVVLDPD